MAQTDHSHQLCASKQLVCPTQVRCLVTVCVVTFASWLVQCWWLKRCSAHHQIVPASLNIFQRHLSKLHQHLLVSCYRNFELTRQRFLNMDFSQLESQKDDISGWEYLKAHPLSQITCFR